MAAPAPHPAPDAERTWAAPWPVALVLNLRPLRRGYHDPCHVEVDRTTVWRTSRQPSGVALALLQQVDECVVRCRAWGPGAEEFTAKLPRLCGADDLHHEFEVGDHDLLHRLHRAHTWLRLPRTDLVFEELPGAILEQRVMAVEAFSSRGWLVRRHGEAPPASPPGMPPQMRVVPSPEAWCAIPSWDWHRAGVDVHRAEALLRCARSANRLDEVATMDPFEGAKRLRAVRGVGVWTAAEVRQRALGD
ncbi:MAG: DNA-3-methyladenine glycosylase 2 family protein, partial [Thermoleophilia bacterium]|nr:DNA-3-methyladenine glycosylase 2 family protein [Thermoleophilia bacterium]